MITQSTTCFSHTHTHTATRFQRKLSYCLVFLLCCSMTSLTAQQRLDLSNYDLIWSDEFDYTGTQEQKQSLMFDDVDIYGNPNEPKWRLGVTDFLVADEGTGAASLVTKKNIEVHDGMAYLRAKSGGGSHLHTDGNYYEYDHTSAFMTVKYDKDYLCAASWGTPCDNYIEGFNYGIFEIRAKLPRSLGDVSAFWFWSGYWQCGDEGSRYKCDTTRHTPPEHPDYDFFPGWEIDVFEAKQKSEDFVYWATIQANGLSTRPDSCRHCATHYDWNNSDPGETFHTYTLAWTPDRVTWFIDGNEIRSEYSDQHHGISQFKMNMILNCRNYANLDSEPFIVDYLRVYRPKDVNYATNHTLQCGGNTIGNYTWNLYHAPGRQQYENTFANTPYTANQNYRQHAIPTVQLQNPTDYYFNKTVSSMVAQNVSQSYSRIYYTKKDGKLYRVINSNLNFSQPTVITTGLHQNTNIAVHPTNGNVYWKDNSNRLKVLYWTGSSSYGIGNVDVSWQYPNDVKGGITVSPSNSYHGTRVYYISTNNDRLCYYEWCNGWHRHETPVTNVKELVISNNPQGKIYYRGIDNHVWVIWKYWDDNTPCNSSSPVSGWSYGPLDAPYSSVYADCAGNLAITPDGSKVFYSTFSNQLAYWKVQGGTSRIITDVVDVAGEIKANQMPDGRTEILYIANNTSSTFRKKIKTYYERTAPQLNGQTLWQNATIDVFSPGQGGIGPNANYTKGFYVGETFAINPNAPTKIFTPYNNSDDAGATHFMGLYVAETNWSSLPHVPFEDCQPYYLKYPWDNGYHVGIEGKIQNINQGEVPALDILVSQNTDKVLLENNTVYPNPTSGNFTVELTMDWCGATVEVFDAQGRVVQTQQSVCNQTIFDLSEFSKGIYLVRITKNGNAQNIKILKQ